MLSQKSVELCMEKEIINSIVSLKGPGISAFKVCFASKKNLRKEESAAEDQKKIFGTAC